MVLPPRNDKLFQTQRDRPAYSVLDCNGPSDDVLVSIDVPISFAQIEKRHGSVGIPIRDPSKKI